MSEWTDVTLGDVLTLQRGFDLPQRKRRPGQYPVVSSAGFTGVHDEFKVEPPGVVIGRYGSLGTVHWVVQPFWPLNTALWVKDFKGNDPRFVFYLLKTVTVDSSAASAVPGVNRNHLHKQRVRVPPVGQQRHIAAFLSAFDSLIEINKRRIELLEALARSLYREWFMDFRFPEYRSAVLVQSGHRRIPVGWSELPMDEVSSSRRGLSWARESEDDGNVGTPIVTIPNIQKRLRVDGCTRLVGVRDSDRAKFSLLAGDILMIGSNGNPERVGQAVRVEADLDALFASFLIRIRPDRKRIIPAILYFQLTEPGIIDDMRRGAVGSTGLRNLRITSLRSAVVLVPPLPLQMRFAKLVDPLLARSHELILQADSLAATRDLLLPRLVTGELDISDIDLGVLTPVEPQ